MWRVTLKGLLAHKLRLTLTALAIVLGVTFITGTFVLTDTLHNTFSNLIGNAIKFTDKGGVCIDVKLIEVNERRSLRFDVRDTGVGVPDDKRDEIFSEFVQADSSHARRFGG